MKKALPSKRRLLLLATVALIGGGIALAFSPFAHQQPEALADGATVEVRVGNAELTATVASAPETQMRGVSVLSGLAEDRGMLFVFAEPRELTFWMKDVTFPIDIMWIRDERVVDVTANVPVAPPHTPDQQLPRYSPKEPADQVLETAAGWTGRHGVNVGDRVKLVR